MKLEAEKIIEQAVRQTGLDDFGGETFRTGLDLLVKGINRDTGRAPEVFAMNEGMFVKTLADRLQVIQALKDRPEVLDEEVKRPVFVFGLPRTGTTLLCNLLSVDPARRSTMRWELDSPVPPPTTATLRTDPRALAAIKAEEEAMAANPEGGKYNRWGPLEPFECVSILAHEFNTLIFESMGELPEYGEYVMNSDWTPGYEYHRKFLQLHQIDAPGVWNLKMPSHIFALPQLLKVYPDARLIWTHRDPYAAAGSLCSLIAGAQMHFAGRSLPEWNGRNYPWQAAQHAERGMKGRAEIGHDRVIDSHYADLVRDPIGQMRKLYAQMGDELTPEAEAAMQAWLAENPQGRFGKHEYKLEQYGTSKDKIAPMFEHYLSEYDIEMEG
jgi:hypothetical protein